jgi:DNA repair exonuclease SbcCD nuclease subunit
VKFLHIADVHLGCTRYQLAESPRDFFDAWMDVLRRYAMDEHVEFVIVCGDFFHKKVVPPETMNYAVEGLNLLKEHGIPVVMIEGNHDQHYSDSRYSWLRSLSNWNLVYLLEPETVEGEIVYSAWDNATKRGGYIDIGRARIFGSHWYGAQSNVAIPRLTEAIKANRRDGAFHTLLLHTDVEGHQMHPIPALTLDSLNKLKEVTDYVGLGHTHMHYEIDNWAFNPGSIEVTNIAEFRETRGAFIVDVAVDNSISVRHVTEYHHRPFQRLTFDVTPYADTKDITRALLEQVGREARVAEDKMPAPIIEVTLRGQLGFPNSLLEMKKIRDEVMKMTGALHVRIKNNPVPTEIGEAEFDENEGREKVERRVVDLIVARDKRFRSNAANISDAVVGAKRMALSDDEPEKIADFIAAKVRESKFVNRESA